MNKIPQLKKRLRQFDASAVLGGIFGDAQLAMIAGVNEFGVTIDVTDKMRAFLAANGLYLKKTTTTITIPERSFLRSTFDNKGVINRILKKTGDFIYQIDVDEKKVLDIIGVNLVAAIRRKIKSNIGPENHPFTIKQKGGKNKTLINESHLLQGITFKIE